MSPLKSALLTGAIASCALIGCTRDRGSADSPPAVVRSAPTAVGGGPPASEPPPVQSAIDRLGEARCARDARCGLIGPEGGYDTMQQCRDADLMSRLDALDPQNCPKGIREDLIEACVQTMANEPCQSTLSAAQCTVASLCSR